MDQVEPLTRRYHLLTAGVTSYCGKAAAGDLMGLFWQVMEFEPYTDDSGAAVSVCAECNDYVWARHDAEATHYTRHDGTAWCQTPVTVYDGAIELRKVTCDKCLAAVEKVVDAHRAIAQGRAR
jgi:hypothetical protein